MTYMRYRINRRWLRKALKSAHGAADLSRKLKAVTSLHVIAQMNSVIIAVQ